MSLKFRTLWLSDIHLGTSASRAADLRDFLGEVSADRIYLAGDIIDMQRIKVRPSFPKTHRRIISHFLRLASTGTEITYIPGNHDIEFRELAGRDICGIRVALEAGYKAQSGKNLLVIHGDILDKQIRRGTSLEKFGVAGYNLLTELDASVNHLRSKLGQDCVPVSARIKKRLNGANESIRRFEQVAANYAADRGFDGIICGHIHRPCLRNINGIQYANDGDLVEHRTALAESVDGSLYILCWQTDSVRVESLSEQAAVAA